MARTADRYLKKDEKLVYKNIVQGFIQDYLQIKDTVKENRRILLMGKLI